MFPISLCRHVIKFMLGRSIHWHDLAFFDADLFENLRKLLLLDSAALESLGLTFEVYIYNMNLTILLYDLYLDSFA